MISLLNLDPPPTGGGWCAPAETVYLDEPVPAVTWLVTIDAHAAMTDSDRAWLDQQWALAEGSLR